MGIVGLATLFAAESVVRRVRNRTETGHRVVDNRPVLLAEHGRLLEDNLRAEGLSFLDIRTALRQNAPGSLADVAAIVLERNGSLSVIPKGRQLDAEVFEDVWREDS